MKFLSKSEVEEFLDNFNHLEDINEGLLELEKLLSTISSASISLIWLLKDNKLISYTYGYEIEWKNIKGLISDSIKFKLPILVNNILNNKRYNYYTDNMLDVPIKDMILYPVIDKNDNIVAILQSIITNDKFHQFIKEDISKLELFSTLILKEFKLYETPQKLELSQFDVDNLISKKIKELIDDKKLLEQKIKDKEQYFAQMIHELRTPLNAILGFAELLKDSDMQEENLDYHNSILTSGDSMLELINNLLDSAKSGSGEQLGVDRVKFSIIEEMDSIILLFASKMQEKSIIFNTYIDPLLPKYIFNDKRKIRQILSNLIGNSIKFTPINGYINFDVLYNEESSKIDFSVEDSGIGIDKSKHNDIFKAYIQEDDTTSDKFGGTGLGLNISKEFVELLGSQLHLDSEKGKGANFYFSLSCNNEYKIDRDIKYFDSNLLVNKKIAILSSNELIDTLATLSRYLNRIGVKNIDIYQDILNIPDDIDILVCSIDKIKFIDRLKSYKIVAYKNGLNQKISDDYDNISILSTPVRFKKFYKLFIDNPKVIENSNSSRVKKLVAVVDDNNITLKYLKVVLEKLGAEVLVGKDGADAIALYQDSITNSKPLDIIFLDEYMQKMNGSEALENIKQISKDKGEKIPIIIGISGIALEEEIEEMKERGYDYIMSKPFSPKIIKEFYRL
ncbi:Sensory box histidine kinase/response regulator [hydrothermal vent metagenome]|uniref:Sensory box histidine kinase/response regulator n=1 Tax=hydrothermal vent metagenome TaxID=652676 RepID=A0A1W1EIZ4_9ZZZZ